MKLDLKPIDYDNPDDYLRAAQATKFLSKLETRIPGLDPSAAAIATWEATEKACFLTNQRLNTLMDFGSIDPNHERLRDFIADVRKNVEWLIGTAPPEVVDGVFGPGATVTDKSTATTVLHKLSSTPSLTHDAWSFLVPWTGTKWATARASHREPPFSFVRGNHYFQVPKNAKTNRSCAKEPSLNAFYQRGYGEVMARRLASRGINIKPSTHSTAPHIYVEKPSGQNAKDVHMQVACAASRSESFATIDLSAASDTMCTALVRHALPPKWFAVLSDLRSPFTLMEGKWRRLEKFSSMGNGFTFELETTLFLAIAMSVEPWLIPGKNLWVFGDDIIVPTGVSRAVCAALRYLGFTTNVEKTFVKGPFRESCGGDYWDGESVRPFYLKEIPNEPQHFIALANGIRRVANQNTNASLLWSDLRRCWFRTLDCIPRSIRVCRGPEQLGDLVIHDDQSYWSCRVRSSFIRFIRVYRPVGGPKVPFRRFCPDTQFAAALYGVSFIEQPRIGCLPRCAEFDDRRHLAMRGPVSGYKVGWISFS